MKKDFILMRRWESPKRISPYMEGETHMAMFQTRSPFNDNR